MRRAKYIWNDLMRIPGFLRAITIMGWIFGPVLVIASLTPGWEFEDNGSVTAISVIEVWRVGVGPIVCIIGMGLILIATMIYKRSVWGRHLLMLFVLLVGASGFIDNDYQDYPLGLLITVCVIVAVVGLRYLYFQPKVVSYFSPKQKAEQGAAE